MEDTMWSRYYAMAAEDEYEVFCSKYGFKNPRGWMVFDRYHTDDGGGEIPIALCVSRHEAFKIRDALNWREQYAAMLSDKRIERGRREIEAAHETSELKVGAEVVCLFERRD
jgi:hypothetical protein